MHEVKIEHFQHGLSVMNVEEMAQLAGESFPIADRVPGAAGEAFDWHRWYTAWARSHDIDTSNMAPTHLMVEAADTFEAAIPWNQLEQAAVLYALEGGPLLKTGPIRLYVPNGSSQCLNVKSIVKLKIARQVSSGQAVASYGFKSTFSADDLRMKK